MSFVSYACVHTSMYCSISQVHGRSDSYQMILKLILICLHFLHHFRSCVLRIITKVNLAGREQMIIHRSRIIKLWKCWSKFRTSISSHHPVSVEAKRCALSSNILNSYSKFKYICISNLNFVTSDFWLLFIEYEFDCGYFNVFINFACWIFCYCSLA